jgi:predicted DNA-binding protein (MmcQ/YjbR family)
MNKTDMLFQRKKLNKEKLLSFGFAEKDGVFKYSTGIIDGQFQMCVIVVEHGAVSAKVIDASSNEEYVLHHTPEAVGSFVGAVRTEYENVLHEIAEKCFEPDIFQSDYAVKIIQHVRNTYHDELEFLWPRFPENAIFRRKDTGKWYSALLVLSERKLGLDSNKVIEIVNLKIKAEDTKALVDGKVYFPGYHMNKKHWITICLDGSVPIDEIFERINTSYSLAIK